MAGQSLNELHELLDRLYDLKAKATSSKTGAVRRKQLKALADGVGDILSATAEVQPTKPSEDAQRAKIRKKAQELRHWVSSHYR